MNSTTKQTFRFYWHHTKQHKWIFVLIFTFVILTVSTDLARPFLLRQLFNTLASGPSQSEQVLKIIVIILGLSVLHNIFWRVVGYANNYFQPRIMSDLMNTCYRYLHKHSTSFFDSSFVGSIVTKVRRFSTAFESLMDNLLFNISRTVLRVVAIVVILFLTKPLIGLFMVCWVIIYISFAIGFARYKLKYDTEKVKKDTQVTAHLADTITNHQNVKLFAAYGKEVSSFEKITEQLFVLRKKTWDLGQHQELFQSISMVILEILVMGSAFIYWKNGQMTIGDFAFLQAYLVDMFNHLWDVGRYIRTGYESIADANEMTEMLMKEHGIVDVPKAKKLSVKDGEIIFKDVTFNYFEGQTILENFNLIIPKGKKIALVGESGGGKSTIVKTLFRFVDLKEGSILIDGQDISKVTQDSLRSQISLVPQEPLLFHRSLLENIRYGKPNATNEEVFVAAKAAHCHEFITKFEQGYETLVGERGVKLSGGERQRVAIARAILRNAPILVLDEATSSLDSESESLIQDALKTLMLGKTTIVIAHRLSTIREMDDIVVIKDGQIAEQGKHEELLKAQQGIYQKLWNIQVGGFKPSPGV